MPLPPLLCHPISKKSRRCGGPRGGHLKSPSVCRREPQDGAMQHPSSHRSQQSHGSTTPRAVRPSLRAPRTHPSALYPYACLGLAPHTRQQSIDRTAVDRLPSPRSPLAPHPTTPHAPKRGERWNQVGFCGLWCPSSLHGKRISALSLVHFSTLLSNGSFGLVWETGDAKEEKEKANKNCASAFEERSERGLGNGHHKLKIGLP